MRRIALVAFCFLASSVVALAVPGPIGSDGASPTSSEGRVLMLAQATTAPPVPVQLPVTAPRMVVIPSTPKAPIPAPNPSVTAPKVVVTPKTSNALISQPTTSTLVPKTGGVTTPAVIQKSPTTATAVVPPASAKGAPAPSKPLGTAVITSATIVKPGVTTIKLPSTPNSSKDCVAYLRDIGAIKATQTVGTTFSQKMANTNSSHFANPKVGDIAVISVSNPKYSTYGHVAVVTAVTPNSITIQEGNYTTMRTGVFVADQRSSTAATLGEAIAQLNIKGFIPAGSK